MTDYRALAATKKIKSGPVVRGPKRDKSDKRYMTVNPNASRPEYNESTRSYELQSKTAGSVKHQMSRRFLLDMYDDWRNHGSDVLTAVRLDDPSTYLRIMASLVPKTLKIEDSSDGKSVSELRTELLVELGRALERGDSQLIEHVESLQRSNGQGPIIEVHAVRETEDVSQERVDAS